MMRTDIREMINALYNKIKERRQIVLLLSMAVVFITTYVLILPAITLDEQTAADQGGIDVPQAQEEIQPPGNEEPTEDAVSDPAQAPEAADTDQPEAKADKPDAEEKSSDAKAEEPDSVKQPSGEKDPAGGKADQEEKTADSLAFAGKGYQVSIAAEKKAALPEDTELTVEELTGKDKDYKVWYDETLKALQETKGGKKIAGLKFAKFYDITLTADGKTVEPEAPVDVTITYDKALPAGDAQHLRIVHFGVDKKGNLKPEVLDDKDVDPTIKKEKMTETTFAAESFSMYAVVYTEDPSQEKAGEKSDSITASGKKYEITVTYDENAEIPEGATLEVTEFAKDSEDYQAAREAVLDKKQAENTGFDESEIGVAAFDLSILDKDGKQVEPKSGVQVSMKIKHLPEEMVEADAQDSIEIHHLDESSGDVKVETVASAADGNIQTEEKTAEAEFQLESFSWFTISWSENASQSSTTARWTHSTGSRVYININYVDENGNAIQRPMNLGGIDGWQQANNGNTVDHWLGNDPGDHEVTLDIQSVLAKNIPGRTFERAYINNNGRQIEVTRVIGRRNTNWNNYNSATYFNNEQTDFVHQDENHNNRLQGTDIYLEYSGGPHTTIHYGYMDDDNNFVEFDQQPSPTNTSTSLGWAHLIHDFYGTDDDGPFQYRYAGTYYSATGETDTPVADGTQIHPLLRYNRNRWKYFDQMDYADLAMGPANAAITNTNNWKNVNDGSDIYLVYEKPVVTPGGRPTLKVDGDLPDAPNILKQSVENDDGTNTLSLSVTGSTEPMVAEKVADVIVILDLSTSMSKPIGGGDKITNYQEDPDSRFYQAKEALQKLATELYNKNEASGAPQYRLGLITFSNKAVVKQMPTASRQEFQTTIRNIVAHDTTEGTNWEHSLMLANQMELPLDRATYIVFITDGAPTVRQTRLNLTDVQLDGVINDPENHGDIFHGGLNNGGFYNNTFGYQADRKHFRDYLENASFGGIAPHEVWNQRNRIAAVDEVKSIIGHNKGFYAIGVSNEASSLETFVTSNEECGLSADHYTIVDNPTSFMSAIDKVLNDLNGITGQADVRVFDGITGLTQTISKVNQTEDGRLAGVDEDFVYYKSSAPEGWSTWTPEQKDAYNLGIKYAGSSETPTEYAGYSQAEKDAFNAGKNITFERWTTRAEDGCAAAKYNTVTKAVEWNMGEKFMLEDGVTYKVSFICWPKQLAYDIIAKLENGTLDFGDTTKYPQEIWDQFEGNAQTGYRVRTNEDGAKTNYKSATNVDGKVTVGSEQDPLFFEHVPPMPLAKDKINVAKTWEASVIDDQDPESVIMQVVGGNEIYKQFEIEPTETVGGSDTLNYARSEDLYISCGHLKVNEDTGAVVVYESGHDFTLREVGNNSRHWDLDASVCRPMKINTEPTMLVLVEGEDIPAGMPGDKDYYASGGDKYYRIDGKVYKATEGEAEITGMNTRRSFLDLAKEVLVDDEVWTEEVDTKFTYKIKIDIDPTTLSWDPDLEKYIIISAYDANGTVVPPASILADQEYQTTAKLPSECGFSASNNTRYLVAETGVEFYFSIRPGWNVRFLNLPVGTEYSIDEVLPADSEYEFNNLRLETKEDNTSAEPDIQTYTAKKFDGSIAETSTLYKVVYQNDAKAQKIMILKTSQDAAEPLGGAKFDLYTQSAYTATPQGEPLKTGLVSSSAEATKGQIDLGSLPTGVYYLMETEAPPGYNKRTEPVIITVSGTTVTYDDGTALSQSGSGVSQSGDAYQLTVTNSSGVVLPNSGGPGTTWIYILGSLLLLVAGVIMVSRRRIREDG